MASPRSLREFIEVLRQEGELAVVEASASPLLEIPEIQRRVAAADGPALLFTRPQGSVCPLACNLMGSPRRIELALGKRPFQFVEDAANAVHTLMPPTLAKLWHHRGFLGQALRIGVARSATGAVLASRMSVTDIRKLPATLSWPGDGGPFLTLPLVYTEHPATGRHNLGIYRMQCHAPTTLGLHWQIGKGGGFHYHAAEELGQSLPVTVTLGGPPALMMAALAPLPEDVPELLLASMLQGKRLEVTSLPGHPHPIAAEAEFVLLGEAPPRVRHAEGPFGDHYGYDSLRHPYPVFECKAIYHRDRPIFPATVVGKPRQEDYYLGEYIQRLLAPLFPLVMPGVRALWSFGETGFHPLTAAVVKERYPREAMAWAFRILGEGQLSLTKFLIAVDRPMDLTDFRVVIKYVLERADFGRDLYVFNHLSQDTLDYTGPEVNRGSKGILLGLGDPVRTLPEAFTGDLPDEFGAPSVIAPGLLVVSGPAYAARTDAASRLARHAGVSAWPVIVLVDDAKVATRTMARFLWTAFTRFEPAGDIHARESRLERHHIGHTPPIVIDARLKPWYPRELECDPAMHRRVTERWKELFPSGSVVMGDCASGHLDNTR